MNIIKLKKLDKIMPKQNIDNKIREYFYSTDANSANSVDSIKIYYHEIQCENNFSVDADVKIVIAPIQTEVKMKRIKKMKLTKKQKNELKLMLELDEIRSMDGDDNIYN